MQQHCYFHKSEFIEHFCALSTVFQTVEQCTLPLCEQCLQIHEEQHNQKSQKPSIIPYREAYEQVFGNLSLFVQNNKKSLQSFTDQVKKDKQEAIKIIENYFKEVETKLEEQTKYLVEIQQKFQKLKKGSIKTVIYYFSGEIALKPLELPEFKEISSQLNKFLKNVHEKQKEEIQTFRQKRNSQPEWSQSKIEPYQPRQQFHSRKKSIFQNDKSKSFVHKNSNEPYLENAPVVLKEEKEELPKRSYENYQRQKNTEQQRSEVGNYFQNYKVEPGNITETNTFKGEMNNFRIESKTLRNYEIESHLGLQSTENNRVLKETSYAINQEHRQIRSRTLDKFPSMIDLKKGRENISRHHNEEDFNKKAVYECKPGKWNKAHNEEDNTTNFDRTPSMFSQLTIHETIGGVTPSTSEFMNRRPLKTTDLETYTPSTGIQQFFEGRERAASYEGGTLRTTMSHNNLSVAGKKMEPLLGDDLKKQVLSPHEIRRMLEKKIEERNKVLTQKKELQLKINPDRAAGTLTLGSANRVVTEQSYKEKNKQRQGQFKYDENTNWNQGQQRPSWYNTKDSIVNHIYRQTKY